MSDVINLSEERNKRARPDGMRNYGAGSKNGFSWSLDVSSDPTPENLRSIANALNWQAQLLDAVAGPFE